MKKFTDFYESYNYLEHHSIVQHDGNYYFNRCLDVEVVKVDPSTNEINFEDESKNTKTTVWLEFGPIVEDTYNDFLTRYIPSHDIDLDCGGDTFEEAIIKLANLTYDKYGYEKTPKEDFTDKL
jgi:hypothetical protein